jgi:hypothetical protein
MTNSKRRIEIATDFSAYPAGREESDGPFNGKKFQTDILLDELKAAAGDGSKVEVSLDGLMSCGSSFLEEAFGGIIRDGHLTRRQVLEHLEVVYSYPRLKRFHDAIFRYVKEAKPKK